MLRFFKFSFLLTVFFSLFIQISAQNQTLKDLLESAGVNERAGNYARAVEDYEALARLKPTAVIYHVKLAENYLRLERDSEAIAAARKAIELEPKNSFAHFFVGKVFFELGQHEEAAQSFQKAIELDSKFAEAFFYLGASEARRGKSENAIAALRQAIALAPDSFNYYIQLGEVLNE
ncbi:MAG TPA: tetratricopeptide repeat protein, partial [Pyrinomonadaceae bacterium]|nr:tetratricopeptide repeat protein [Pyrinomonadaceae bacterium]